MNPLNNYQTLLSQYNKTKTELKNKQKHLPTLRFVSFIVAALFFYQFLTSYQNIYLAISILLIITLIILSYFDLVLKNKIAKTEQFIKINENEIEALKHNFSMFDGGLEFINPEHPYSNDLDLFGLNSLFQYINRTATIFGKKKLAHFFTNAIDIKEQISERQAAISELADNIDFRQKLQTIFFDQNPNESDFKELNAWLNHKSTIPQNRFIKPVMYSYIFITVSCILLYFARIVPYQIPLILFLSQLLTNSLFLRFFIKSQNVVNAKYKIISKYALCLQLIENTSFKSPLLFELNNSLNHKNTKPSIIISKLAKIINWMDSNLNIAVAMILNGTFLFSTLLTYKAENWKKN
ncbi:MAG: hypothetical protein WCK02_12235 [Bacteroidota bacterium]